MDYLFYCRDKPDSGGLLERWAEAHWSFMDRYADSMVARGPTMTEEGGSHTGSLHMVSLADLAAARVFAYEEPYYKHGVYRTVFMSRWHNALGRTMWQFEGDERKNRRFLVIGHCEQGMSGDRQGLEEAQLRYLVEHGYQERLITYGPLLSDDAQVWTGTAMTVELPDRRAVEAMMADAPIMRAELYDSLEVHRWQFGGRPHSVVSNDAP
jgi:uncharacterized protein YciI